jgi:signal transduction histidine kinase
MNVLLCDMADEVTRLQYGLLAIDPSLEIQVTTVAPRAVELAARTQPDVVVTELSMEELKGAELVARLRESAPTTRVFGWTRLRDPVRIARVLSAGAAGYLLKEDGVDEASRAIHMGAAAGGVVLSRSAAALIGQDLGDALARVAELEAEVDAARHEMYEGTVAKADFLSNISHELRTPLTVAKGIAHVVAKADVPEEERMRFLDQLRGSIDKLAQMVDEMIEIADLERGELELDIQHVDLAPSLTYAVAEIGEQYPTVPVVSRIPEFLWALADGNRVAGVVRELLDNACRYSAEGQTVEVRARVLDEGIVISVTDHGQGMGRDVAQRSFDQPFSTGEATLRKEKAGVGVGLHLSRQLIVRHGGILWTDPVPAGGTRVSFCLPSRPGATFEAPPGAA